VVRSAQLTWFVVTIPDVTTHLMHKYPLQQDTTRRHAPTDTSHLPRHHSMAAADTLACPYVQYGDSGGRTPVRHRRLLLAETRARALKLPLSCPSNPRPAHSAQAERPRQPVPERPSRRRQRGQLSRCRRLQLLATCHDATRARRAWKRKRPASWP